MSESSKEVVAVVLVVLLFVGLLTGLIYAAATRTCDVTGCSGRGCETVIVCTDDKARIILGLSPDDQAE